MGWGCPRGEAHLRTAAPNTRPPGLRVQTPAPGGCPDLLFLTPGFPLKRHLSLSYGAHRVTHKLSRSCHSKPSPLQPWWRYGEVVGLRFPVLRLLGSWAGRSDSEAFHGREWVGLSQTNCPG